MDLSRKGRRKKILNEKRKDLCFYSREIECNWEWIRSSIGEIGGNIAQVYSRTRLSDSNFQRQASQASDFISYVDKEAKAGPASPLRNANQIARTV